MQKIVIFVCLLALFPMAAFAQEMCCPDCGSKVAIGTPENSKVKKKVYKVECKDIAIPDIQMPFPLYRIREQFCNLFAPKCIPGMPCGCEEGCTCEPVRHGCVRTIKVMSKKEVECEVCKYKWEVKDFCGCASDGCDVGGCDVGPMLHETPPVEGDVMPQAQPAQSPQTTMQRFIGQPQSPFVRQPRVPQTLHSRVPQGVAPQGAAPQGVSRGVIQQVQPGVNQGQPVVPRMIPAQPYRQPQTNATRAGYPAGPNVGSHAVQNSTPKGPQNPYSVNLSISDQTMNRDVYSKGTDKPYKAKKPVRYGR